MPIDVNAIKRELYDLTADALYEHTLTVLRLGARSKGDPLDRAWREQCCAEWHRRGRPDKFTAAVAAVRAEIDAAREENWRACRELPRRG